MKYLRGHYSSKVEDRPTLVQLVNVTWLQYKSIEIMMIFQFWHFDPIRKNETCNFCEITPFGLFDYNIIRQTKQNENSKSNF